MIADQDLADEYVVAIEAAAKSSYDAEPEAQLTTPVQRLFEQVAAQVGLDLRLLREVRLDGVRPDFGALLKGRPCGWIELKAPSKPVDGDAWRGRDAKQWQLLRDLDALIVTNGEQARLYRTGEQVTTIDLPTGEAWSAEGLTTLLRLFVESRPATVTRVSDLAKRLAPLARLLRDRLTDLLASGHGPTKQAHRAWRAHVHEGANAAAFANDIAQTIAYSLAIAALRGEADRDKDGQITLDEAKAALAGPNPALSAALGPALSFPEMLNAMRLELSAVERLVSAVDAEKVRRSKDPRGEAWLWFYEDFLAAYDPEARKGSGVYYTPEAVVKHQVAFVDDLLRHRLGKRFSYADDGVTVLDPACGSGTYPLAVIDQAELVAQAERGPAGGQQVAKQLTANLTAFELLPGPYAVAHLRIGQRLAEVAGALIPPGQVHVFLTDTLDDNDPGAADPTLFGDPATLAEERRRALAAKTEQPVMVIIGNPPYQRVARERHQGSAVMRPRAGGRSLFDDMLEPASARTIFSHVASLYNLYTYFWRWSLWKAFEAHGTGPAVVSFITARSWLDGPGFYGLREIARKHADDIWVTDLGGDNHGAIPEDNVFDIETPVAIVTLLRERTKGEGAGRVHYRRIHGKRQDKYDALAGIGTSDEWTAVTHAELGDPMVPVAGGSDWQAFPSLADLLPWQQPGCMFNRTWPIAPDPETLARRWAALMAAPSSEARAAAFVTASSGRNIHTRVAGLRTLSEELPDAAPQRMVRYGYRSFDREWTFADPRLAKTESPALWSSVSDQQVFLTTMTTAQLGEGPALTVATAVPDKHYFCGRGGKDVIPLYRDAEAQQPNVTVGLLDSWRAALGVDAVPTPEDLAAYVYAVLAHPGYQRRFADALVTPGPRVPLTSDPALFVEAVTIGRRLLRLQTFGERFTEADGAAGGIPRADGAGWAKAVTTMPATTADITYDASRQTIVIGDGEITGVRPDVWAFSVSGMQVLPKWLGYRTRKGTGRAATQPKPLDLIRPESWVDDWNDELIDLVSILTATVDLQTAQADLLDRIVAGPLVAASDLPEPTASERKPPKVG